MFFVFAAKVSSIFVNFDIGSQFIRGAVIENNGSPSMASNKHGSTMTPNSVSFKLQNMQEGHLKNSNLTGLQIKYGKSSLQYLKYNPQNGASYLGRLMGRNSTENFEIPTIATASEMFSFLLKDTLEAKDFLGVEGVTFTIPAYYTYRQREALIKATYLAKIPFLGLIEDFQAAIWAYTDKYLDRFAKTNHSVLFIDVGASHTAAFRVDFYCNTSTIVANMTSYEWTEEAGSFAFARSISLEENINFRKAMKIVEKGKYSREIVESELEELQRIILLAMGNEEIDCVQVIGGASKLPYIEDVIKDATDIDISRELPNLDTNALGGAFLTQRLANKANWPITFIRCPIYTQKLRCDKVAATYCTKGAKCNELVILDNTICNELFLEAEEKEIPEGTNNLIAGFTLTNISKWDREEEEFVSGIMIMKEPLPQITSVNWCITSTLNCQPISFQQTEINFKSFQSSFDFVDSVRSVLLRQKRIIQLKGQLRSLIDEALIKGGEKMEIAEKARSIADNSEDIPTLEQYVKLLTEEEKKKENKVNENEMFYIEDEDEL